MPNFSQQVLKPVVLSSGLMLTVSTVTFFGFFDNKWYNNLCRMENNTDSLGLQKHPNHLPTSL